MARGDIDLGAGVSWGGAADTDPTIRVRHGFGPINSLVHARGKDPFGSESFSFFCLASVSRGWRNSRNGGKTSLHYGNCGVKNGHKA